MAIARGENMRRFAVALLCTIGQARGSSWASATMSRYNATDSVYDGEYDVNGTVYVVDIDDDTGIEISGILSDLESNVTAGLHIHEGTSCSDPGSHYYDDDEEDPWTNDYETDVYGIAEIDIEIFGFSLSGFNTTLAVLNHTVVVHASDGTRLACGVLTAESTMPPTGTPAPSPLPTPLPTPMPSIMPTATGPPTSSSMSSGGKKKKKSSGLSPGSIGAIAAVSVIAGIALLGTAVYFSTNGGRGREQSDEFLNVASPIQEMVTNDT